MRAPSDTCPIPCTGRIEYLDTLRFLAVALIMFDHFRVQVFAPAYGFDILQPFFDPPAPSSWILYGYTGKYALALMCMISGYLIASQAAEKTFSLPSFIIKRYFRLILPCAAVTLALYILHLILGDPLSVRCTIASAVWPGNDFANPHYWCIDEFFVGNVLAVLYFTVFPNKAESPNSSGPVSAPVFIKQNAPLCLLTILVFAAGQVWISACICGALTFQTARRFHRSFSRWYTVIPAAFCIWWLRRGVYAPYADITYGRNLLGAALLLTLFASLPVLQNFFDWHGLRIRKISYSLFVWHYVTYTPAEKMIGYLLHEGMTPISVFFLVFAGKTAVDLCVAYLLYELVERRLFQKILSWFRSHTAFPL